MIFLETSRRSMDKCLKGGGVVERCFQAFCVRMKSVLTFPTCFPVACACWRKIWNLRRFFPDGRRWGSDLRAYRLTPLSVCPLCFLCTVEIGSLSFPLSWLRPSHHLVLWNQKSNKLLFFKFLGHGIFPKATEKSFIQCPSNWSGHRTAISAKYWSLC